MHLTVATWNCAHGRGCGPDLRRLLPSARRRTLDRIGDRLAAWQVDVAALQEVDGPSWWSGAFDHPRHIAQGRFAHGLHGKHVHTAGLRYGTALLSRRCIDVPEVCTFASSFPTPRKGFVVARTRLSGRDVDVYSVHLDFTRVSVRRRQLADLTDTLRRRRRPAVVMGDFNQAPDHPIVQEFLAATGLAVAEHGAPTFLKLGHRIDLVCTSPELVRVEQLVPEVDLSDHRPVVARLAWA